MSASDPQFVLEHECGVFMPCFPTVLGVEALPVPAVGAVPYIVEVVLFLRPTAEHPDAAAVDCGAEPDAGIPRCVLGFACPLNAIAG